MMPTAHSVVRSLMTDRLTVRRGERKLERLSWSEPGTVDFEEFHVPIGIEPERGAEFVFTPDVDCSAITAILTVGQRCRVYVFVQCTHTSEYV